MTTATKERVCEYCDEREAPPDARECLVCTTYRQRQEAERELAEAALFRVEEDGPESVIASVNRRILEGWQPHSLTTVSETNGDGNLVATLVAVLRNEGYCPERHRRAQERLDARIREFHDAKLRYMCPSCLGFVFELDRACSRCRDKALDSPAQLVGPAHES